ncbi:MAG: SAM-dependent chlorinase/fluorinase [Bacteroidetes bacterium]|nr:SAM-dependent chlorinase/fluorinase [Bacteroidota bacterium]
MTGCFEEFYARAICSLISEAPGSGFGPLCSSPKTFPVQDPLLKGDSILGEILFSDNFGNCITNISDSITAKFPLGTVFTLKSDTLHQNLVLGTTYSSVPVGDNVCFINSSKLLELAINYGNFSGTYHLGAGTRINLSPKK